MELAELAEDGSNAALKMLLEASSPDVFDVVTDMASGDPGANIKPGASAEYEIRSRGKADSLSIVGMLVITNDAFFGVTRTLSSKSRRSMSFSAVAYDAGSEVNNEECAYIPGPPCGSPFMNPMVGAEGYVYIHNGIHGSPDLDASLFDWRNPVARVKVMRTH